MEANFHRQEHVIQLPGRRRLMHDKDEFLAKSTLRQNTALSLRQWLICRQQLQNCMFERKSTAYLLRRQHPFPKWDH
jgi:hypothetical protein